MTSAQIRFEDGRDYEQYMGKWSQLVGEAFLDWLAPEAGLHWLDIGCGSGAFTESIFERCSPAFVDGIDPSEAQLAFARARLAGRAATFRQGDAMALPFADDVVDVAVMPLVIFFVPEPARGVAEMARVIRSGGIATAYAWDMDGGGFPYQTLQDEMRAMGIPVPVPPSREASRLEVMRELWTNAGLEGVETRVITVERTFAGFDDYWTTVLKGPSVGPQLRALSSHDVSVLQARMRTRLPMVADGRMTCPAHAHAVKGRARISGGNG
jgi:SAM-dependent methyltransferase